MLTKWLRAMMKGKAHWEDKKGQHHALNNEEVRQHWRITICRTTLRVRRFRKYQQWARSPDDFKQVTAAIFGQTWHERDLGVERFEEDGGTTERSTPWAKQIEEDFQILGEQETAEEWKWVRGKTPSAPSQTTR